MKCVLDWADSDLVEILFNVKCSNDFRSVPHACDIFNWK